jgi:hypothetical protein
MLALLLVFALTQPAKQARGQTCPGPRDPVRTLLHFGVGIAGGNTCTVPQLGGALVNNKLPARFELAQYTNPETPTNQEPGLPSLNFHGKILKPITDAQQAELDSVAEVTGSDDFSADLIERLKHLNLTLVKAGPELHKGHAVILVGVEQKVTLRIQEQLDEEMQGIGQGYPVLLSTKARSRLRARRNFWSPKK